MYEVSLVKGNTELRGSGFDVYSKRKARKTL